MRVLPALLSSLPLLITAAPTIIPIAVDQNLSPSTLDISPDQLDGAGSPDSSPIEQYGEPFSLDSPLDIPPSPPVTSSSEPPPLISANTQACGLSDSKPCPQGQLCFRASYNHDCAEKKTCGATPGVCKSKVGGLSGTLQSVANAAYAAASSSGGRWAMGLKNFPGGGLGR